MTDNVETPACYRDRDNGVRYQRQRHRHDCADPNCRGCTPCPEPNHCTARRNCTWHVDPNHQTCGRCITAVRRDLHWAADLAALTPTAAMGDGINSEAANLAGPAPHPGTEISRRVHTRRRLAKLGPFAAAAGIDETGYQVIPDEDEHHPYAVLGRWALMIAEDYGHTLGDITVATAAAYLDRHLHRIAQDPDQDFPLLGRELRKCRQHLEAVLHNDNRPDRGAPCPACAEQGVKPAPRLRRHFGHWCDDQTCERIHHGDDTDDVWRCPRDKAHEWTEHDYRLRVANWHHDATA